MIPPLCFITDAQAPHGIVEQSLAAARGGAGWVQLRHKTMPDDEFAMLGLLLIDLLAAEGVGLVINDRVDVAVSLGAAGLHIGQGDGDPVAIRQRVGPEMILGLSVENAGQLSAVPAGVDYLGVGPVRETASKPDHAPPIGMAGLAAIAGATRLPCLAIGGIGPGDLAAVKAAGAAGVAVVSAISRAPDMQAAARALAQEWARA